MLTIVAVVSLRSLPTMATYGLGSITLYVIPALLFLVPTALVAAELATGWKGGVYVWVREAMGNRWGFEAIWLQWVQNVVWYPTQLAFVAASLAYMSSVPAWRTPGSSPPRSSSSSTGGRRCSPCGAAACSRRSVRGAA